MEDGIKMNISDLLKDVFSMATIGKKYILFYYYFRLKNMSKQDQARKYAHMLRNI